VSGRGLGLRVLAFLLLLAAVWLFFQGSAQLAVLVALGGLCSYLASRAAA
jgi:hypothetical protein